MATQLATRVNDEQAKLFKSYTAQLGTTPSDALRILVAAFNQHKGFPCEIRLNSAAKLEPFKSEEEATKFSDSLANEVIDNAW